MTRNTAILELWELTELDYHYDEPCDISTMETILNEMYTNLEHEITIIQGNY